MQADGWVGKPIDVVKFSDGSLVTIDNTRVLAAHRAGIPVRAVVHDASAPLPSNFIGRFTTPKGGTPKTWGEGVLNRIGSQNSLFRQTYPQGSPFTGSAE
ncbi:MAG: hypothetical protein HQM08_29460 [Candidatus Riflebacteria bacterium]|nr:hypothetical protein [Candidatus Riflebacteria bacterium]